jgi:tetratricopeptide (TPR) repeat protein
MKGDYPGSIEQFSKCIGLDRKFVDAYYHRGVSYAVLKKYQEAMADFNTCIELKPDYHEAYLNRAVARINLGQSQEGCNDLQKAKELGNKDTDEYILMYCSSK